MAKRFISVNPLPARLSKVNVSPWPNRTSRAMKSWRKRFGKT
jgi:hypothetical protein